jgi:hypothetical protein
MAQAALLPIQPAGAPGPGADLRAVHEVPGDVAAPVPRVEIPEYDLAAALALRHELGVSHAFAQVLVRRGLADPQAARDFLRAGETHDSAEFAGIEAAVDAIRRRIESGGRILVHGD